MAWRGYLAERVLKPVDSTSIKVSIVYYDDADPANANVSTTVPPPVVLHAKQFQFAPLTALVEMQRAIREEGDRARSSVNQADSINTNFPVGTTITIP